jgi:hypothetical protein
MTKREWSHLPNAEHIDWVIKTLKENPEVWEAARSAAWDAVWEVASDAAWKAMREAVGAAARNAAWKYVWGAAWGDAGEAARKASWNAIAALIVWDGSSELLDKSVEEVEGLVKEGNHAAVLLLPAVVVKNKLKKNTKLNKPRLFFDEGVWCALLGDNIQDEICGYGDSPADAMRDYEKNKLKENA